MDDGREIKRQLFHIIIGICALAVLLIWGRGILMGVTFFILIIGLLLINQAYLGRRIGPVDWFIKNFEREDVRFPGWGSACYATGVLLFSAFLNNQAEIAAAIIIIGIGDGLSTLIGRKFGKIKLPYNSNKTVEGSLALFAVSLLGWFFIGPEIIPAAIIAAIIEGLPIPIDDNLSIPVALVLFFMVL
ncbi:MAG: hypothetical protein V1492_05045 [Candidatus Micrarchaeota archaeon]